MPTNSSKWELLINTMELCPECLCAINVVSVTFPGPRERPHASNICTSGFSVWELLPVVAGHTAGPPASSTTTSAQSAELSLVVTTPSKTPLIAILDDEALADLMHQKSMY